jgi:uncharacterized iron-regulated protein
MSLPRSLRRALPSIAAALLSGCAIAPGPDLEFNADLLAAALARRPVVLLGEVHDNAVQHRVRADALRRLLEQGARPAIAFEQFDREQQPLIDRVRREPPPAGTARADHLIAQAKPARANWNWPLYRPFVELALEYDLPIVAANLSRAEAMKVGSQGYDAVFEAAAQKAFGLDRLPPEFLREHEHAIDEGHCRLMPAHLLPQLARSQIARDAAMAQAIRPHLARGVVLLTGNGHARSDIGAAHFLTPAERERVLTIGLLERGGTASTMAQHFDIAFATPPQPRADPCAELRDRLTAPR